MKNESKIPITRTVQDQELISELVEALRGLLKHFEGSQSLAVQSGLNYNCYAPELEVAKQALKKAGE